MGDVKSQLLGCNGGIEDLFQMIEYSEILENVSMSLIVSVTLVGWSA